jgi:hypothetical protein
MSETFGARASESLVQFLTSRARNASEGRLVVDVAVGTLAMVAVLFWHPWGWLPLLSAAVGLAAFGSWGILDRELGERAAAAGIASRLLRAARIVAGAIGWIAFIAFILSVIALGLGEWKS